VRNFDEARSVARSTGADILIADVRHAFPASEFDLEAERFSPTKGHAREDLDFIKKYIRNHYNEKINLQKIANLACLSTTYLCYLFKQVEGITIHAYIEHIRMEKAAYMLITEDRIIRDIAEEVGYPQSTYFTKLFIKHFGMKPVEYRVSHRPSAIKNKWPERMKVADGK
jgi:AraC-like DNA-binding protein